MEISVIFIIQMTKVVLYFSCIESIWFISTDEVLSAMYAAFGKWIFASWYKLSSCYGLFLGQILSADFQVIECPLFFIHILSPHICLACLCRL